jgi:hypothetical protein
MNGSDRPWVRAIRGPITIITVGVLFALNNFTSYSFNKTWPVILIVFGLLSLLRRGTHPEYPQPPRYPYTAPPYQPPAGSYNAPPQGTYNAPPPSAYNAPPAGRGGFGTSAPPRTEPAQDVPPSQGGQS